MKVFADTAYFIALLNGKDTAHDLALHYARQSFRLIAVTEFILLELADAFSRPPDRGDCLSMDRHVRSNPCYTVLPASSELLQRGRDLFAARPDKAWSLTDCTSFVVMQEFGIIDALTTDQHFTQAGFRALLVTDKYGAISWARLQPQHWRRVARVLLRGKGVDDSVAR